MGNGTSRELVVLGTASQAPTRYRNHNGYLLHFDDQGILFDPGEGTQRQMILAGVSASSVTRICITHFHGDHCLGLPGLVQRLSLDAVPHTVPVAFPAAGQEYYDRLLTCSAYDQRVDVRPEPVAADGVVDPGPPLVLRAAALSHRVPTIGWRIEEPPARRMLPERLRAAGVTGPAVGELQRRGTLEVGGRTVTLAEMSEPRPPQAVAFVMDTGLCDAAFALADGVDLLVCEATFAGADADLAARYQHLTAADAATVAARAGARRLVLTHFSQRYPDVTPLVAEAAEIFPDVVAAEDLARIPLPARR